MANEEEHSVRPTAGAVAEVAEAQPAAVNAPASPAPTPAKPGSERDKPINKLRRRIVWGAIGSYLTANFVMFLRYFFPRVLFEPNTIHNIGYPTDFDIGVNQQYKQAYRIWVVRMPPKLYVIYAKCTHLGCTPDWIPSQHIYHCPCHGSEYTESGINFAGPAPRPMDRCHIDLNAQGQIIVNTAQRYSWWPGGKDNFLDKGAYIIVT